jgi:hypothetical protein
MKLKLLSSIIFLLCISLFLYLGYWQLERAQEKEYIAKLYEERQSSPLKKLSIIKIGFRFIFQANDKTLTDVEVDAIIKNITEYSSKIKGVEIPGLT